MKFIIEIAKDNVTPAEMAEALTSLILGFSGNEDDLKEQMDGSFRFDTPIGAAFLSIEE
jgi:hypothetical protein